MRRLAVAVVLIGAILCAAGLLVIPLAIDGFQYGQVDVLSGTNLHIAPAWGAPVYANWLEPTAVTVQQTDPPSFSGHPHRVLNLSALPIPTKIRTDSVLVVVDVVVTGDAANLYIFDQENLTNWENGIWADAVLELSYFQGSANMWWGVSGREIKPPMYLVLEASNPRPPDIGVTLSLSASWTPATGSPDFAMAASATPTIAESAMDIRLEGEANEANGTLFDLLIFDRMTPDSWAAGTQPSPLFDESGKDFHRFFIPLQISDVQGASLTFIVRIPGDTFGNLDVNVSARIGWWEPALAATRPFLGTLGVVLGFAGIAVAAGGILLEVSPAPNGRPDKEMKSARP